jgi:hypothetical protein
LALGMTETLSSQPACSIKTYESKSRPKKRAIIPIRPCPSRITICISINSSGPTTTPHDADDEASPGGRFENRPAVDCRVRICGCMSPEGTAESIAGHMSVPITVETPDRVRGAVFVGGIQPSLRDSMPFVHQPTLERVGYSRFSLREKPGQYVQIPASAERGRGCRSATTATFKKLRCTWDVNRNQNLILLNPLSCYSQFSSDEGLS